MTTIKHLTKPLLMRSAMGRSMHVEWSGCVNMEGVDISGVKYLSFCYLTDVLECNLANSPGVPHIESRRGLSIKFCHSIQLLSLRI